MIQLTSFEKAYDQGQEDAAHSVFMIPYEDWCSGGHIGSYSSYKAGYEDYINDQWPEDEEL